MASSSRKKAGNVKHGPSYVKIYKNDKGFTGHHQNDPHTAFKEIDDTSKEERPPHPSFIEIDDTSKEERPPYVIVVQGPPRVGKTLLIKCLEEYYSKRNVVGIDRCFCLGDNRRIQFVECPNNVNGMIDAAKYADAVVFVIDVGYGFEMETFEFLELLKVHGMPKVMGVLTYLDSFKETKIRTYHRQHIIDRFQTEICKGAKTFCLSGLDNDMYFEHEISELASVISTMEFHPLSWRAARPYMLVDHFEDVTLLEKVKMDQECPRDIMLEGYLRGCDFENGSKVHIAGVGDFPVASVTILADPFPIPPVNTSNLKTNIEEVSNHDKLTCMEIECYRAGTYVRFEIHDVPFEMVKNHDPCQPILVGGVSLDEANVGYMQVRLERHSWHKKLLKTKDPIIVSVGWRRYQTIPMYSMKDCRGRNRVLDYTPKNKPCLATFWGPLAPPSTGVAVVQSLADNKAAFRILAKASVLEFNKGMDIVKKRKRIGPPYKIFRDATIKTASGIFGKLDEKDLIRGEDGIAKCAFKCKIHLRDAFLMHVYEQVEVPRFFNPVVRGPEPPDRIWQGVVDSSDLYVPANLDSYHKRYVNPFEPRDRKLHKRWMSLLLAQDRATSEAEKLSIKHQLDALGIERDERLREKELEALAPRRQTLEQIRAVRFVESEKKMEKIEKQLASSQEDEDSFRQLSEDLLKKFEEYLKGEKEMTTSTVCPASYSGFQVRHGTTCIAIINSSGLYYSADGRATRSNPTKPDAFKIVDEDAQKIHILAERILVLVAGNSLWEEWILKVLRRVITAEWNCWRCARYANFLQETVGPEPLIQFYELEPGALDGCSCSMIFGSYENGLPTAFYGDDLTYYEIVDMNLWMGGEDRRSTCFETMGSGGRIASQDICRSIQSGVSISLGDLSPWEEHVIVMLSAMKAASDKVESTGGTVQVYRMSPPDGVPELVHKGYHTFIPLDIMMFRTNMYYRLYREAIEADNYDEASGNHGRFLEASGEYENALQVAIDLGKAFVISLEERKEMVRKQEQQLVRSKYLIFSRKPLMSHRIRQIKRERLAMKKETIAKTKSDTEKYQKLLATRLRELRERRSESEAEML